MVDVGVDEKALTHLLEKVLVADAHAPVTLALEKAGMRTASDLVSLQNSDTKTSARQILVRTVERISLGSLWQSLKTTVATLTDPHVILRPLWFA